MERRKFLKQAGLVSTWIGVSVVVQACSSYDDPGDPAPAVGAGDVSGSIASNHGHAVSITDAQIDSGDAVTLTLGGGGHAHSVSLTAEQVGDIGAGTRVQTTSTSGAGHTHTVTFN